MNYYLNNLIANVAFNVAKTNVQNFTEILPHKVFARLLPWMYSCEASDLILGQNND